MPVVTLDRAERVAVILLTIVVLVVVTTHAVHAGALWRDECAALQLATMPSFTEVAQNFPHEAFPLVFPGTLRLYTDLFGSSDSALRTFGVGSAIMLVGLASYLNRAGGMGRPLYLLALFGLNESFIIWGTGVRAYGIGSLLAIASLGLISELFLDRNPTRIVAAVLVAIVSVQYLVNNVVIVAALTFSAGAVCLYRRHFKLMFVAVGIAMSSAASLLPYLGSYLNARDWSMIIRQPFTPRLFLYKLSLAFRTPLPVLPRTWVALHLVVIAGIAIHVYFARRRSSPVERDLLVFALLVSITSVSGYYIFLERLSYPTELWYYLPLLGILAYNLDLFTGTSRHRAWFRWVRLALVGVVLGYLPFNDWSATVARATNIDVIAHRLEKDAKTGDLIVLVPWHLGISFSRYYHGGVHWTTAPQVSDHRIHRYDLIKAKMLSANPLDDVFEMISRTLASGNRVWFVGTVVFPQGRSPLQLSPAPDARFGWRYYFYSVSWAEQIGTFLEKHATDGQWVALSSSRPVSRFEKAQLLVVRGWRSEQVGDPPLESASCAASSSGCVTSAANDHRLWSNRLDATYKGSLTLSGDD